jgi:hypothetical protein
MRTKKQDYSAEFRKLALARKGLVKARIEGLTVGKIEKYSPFASFSFRRWISCVALNGSEYQGSLGGGSVTVNGDTGLLHLVFNGSGKATEDSADTMIDAIVRCIMAYAERNGEKF